jgi:hypothetical protein
MRKKKNSTINIDGKPHRKRRGKLVEIPTAWLGKIPHNTKRRSRDARTRNGCTTKDAQGVGETPGRTHLAVRGEELAKLPAPDEQRKGRGAAHRPYNRIARNDREQEAIVEQTEE